MGYRQGRLESKNYLAGNIFEVLLVDRERRMFKGSVFGGPVDRPARECPVLALPMNSNKISKEPEVVDIVKAYTSVCCRFPLFESLKHIPSTVSFPAVCRFSPFSSRYHKSKKRHFATF